MYLPLPFTVLNLPFDLSRLLRSNNGGKNYALGTSKHSFIAMNKWTDILNYEVDAMFI